MILKTKQAIFNKNQEIIFYCLILPIKRNLKTNFRTNLYLKNDFSGLYFIMKLEITNMISLVGCSTNQNHKKNGKGENSTRWKLSSIVRSWRLFIQVMFLIQFNLSYQLKFCESYGENWEVMKKLYTKQ